MSAQRILYIEDEENLRLVYSLALAKKGYEVTLANDGLAGIETARDMRPDLILTDFQMPLANGIQVIETLREDPHFSNTPIVMFSGSDMSDEAIKAGANAFVPKPCQLQDLYEIVESFLPDHPEQQLPPTPKRAALS